MESSPLYYYENKTLKEIVTRTQVTYMCLLKQYFIVISTTHRRLMVCTLSHTLTRVTTVSCVAPQPLMLPRARVGFAMIILA